MRTKTFIIEDQPIVFLVEGNRGIVINPMEDRVEIDTQIPSEVEDPFSYLLEDYEDAIL